jgi:hypothetical protein
MNGDGYGDFAIDAPTAMSGQAYVGEAFVCLGGAAGPSSSQCTAIANPDPSTSNFGEIMVH